MGGAEVCRGACVRYLDGEGSGELRDEGLGGAVHDGEGVGDVAGHARCEQEAPCDGAAQRNEEDKEEEEEEATGCGLLCAPLMFFLSICCKKWCVTLTHAVALHSRLASWLSSVVWSKNPVTSATDKGTRASKGGGGGCEERGQTTHRCNRHY